MDNRRSETIGFIIRYLQTKPSLNGRQARWLDFLQEYDFEENHIPGVKNIVPDSLSRRADHALKLKFMKLQDPKFKDRIIEGYANNEWAQKIIDVLNDKFSEEKDKPKDYQKVKSQSLNYKYEDKLLYWISSEKARIYVRADDQLRKDIIEGFHWSPGQG